LSDLTVGAYSTLTIALTTVHAIPQDGAIEIEFPKWNSFASQQSQMESFVATSTSPGTVTCDAISNLPVTTGTTIGCLFTHGTTIDTLNLIFDGYLSSDVPTATTLSFSVGGVRAPPTTSSITGFLYRTTSQSGDVIDQSNAVNTISL